YVDLVSERTYRYKPGQASDLIQVIPEDLQEREQTARREMLESLADFDDALLEQLLEDSVPSKEAVYAQLTKDLAGDLIVPVFLGAAEREHGVRRLLKALRHEVPGPAETAKRIGVQPGAGDTAVLVVKTYHLPHTGKLSLARVWGGALAENASLDGMRVGSLNRIKGHELTKLPSAAAGEVVALGRMEQVTTGQLLSVSGRPAGKVAWPERLAPLFSLALDAVNRA